MDEQSVQLLFRQLVEQLNCWIDSQIV